MKREKNTDVFAGYFVADIRHASFDRQLEMARMLVPGYEYYEGKSLVLINNPLTKETREELGRFTAEAMEQ